MDFVPGAYYYIKNKASGLVLNLSGFNRKPGARVEQWDRQVDGNSVLQQWFFFPIDSGAYLIVNRGTGLCLDIEGHSDALCSQAVQWQLPTNAEFGRGDRFEGGGSQSNRFWKILDSGGSSRITNEASGHYLNIKSNSTDAGERCELWRHEQNDSQLWLFEEAGRLPNLPQPRTPESISPPALLTSYDLPQTDVTREAFVGQALIPFPFILASSTRDWQLENSVYYTLSHYAYWENVYAYAHSGASDVTETKKVTVGIVTSNSTMVEETTGISVTAEAAFEYGGASSTISTTLTKELKVTNSSSETKSHTKEVELSRSYKAEKRVTEVIWVRCDRYELKDLAGGKLLEWRTRDENARASMSYPP